MRRTLGFALAAGLVSLALAPAPAHAQSSFGYDSWYYNLPQAVNYYGAAGYPGLYTDPSTATFANGTEAQMRPIAPYVLPPYGTYTVGDPLRQTGTAGVTVAPGAAPQVLVAPRALPAQRRGIFGRIRNRR